MREVLFRDTVEKERRKRFILVHEEFRQNRVDYKTDTKVIFRLKDVHAFNDELSAQQWINNRCLSQDSSRKLSILRIHDRKLGKELWQSKMIGTLYVVQGSVVLTVLFMQVYRLTAKSR